MSAIAELKERRAALAAAMAEIDAVLRQLGGTVKRSKGKATNANASRSEAAKKMWAKRRAAAPTPKVKTRTQRAKNAAHPRQSVVPQKPQGASLAAAAEG